MFLNEKRDTLFRFRIVVQVVDRSGTTTLTLFDKEAEQLVGLHLQTILADQVEVKTYHFTTTYTHNQYINKLMKTQK